MSDSLALDAPRVPTSTRPYVLQVPAWLRRSGVEEILKCGPTKVHELVHAGYLTPVRYGHREVAYSSREVIALRNRLAADAGLFPTLDEGGAEALIAEAEKAFASAAVLVRAHLEPADVIASLRCTFDELVAAIRFAATA